MQSDGKSEYYGFDRALSIKRKIDLGFDLKEQLRDDPRYAKANEKELEKAVKECQRDYLHPLDCADRYLAHLGREQIYELISTEFRIKKGAGKRSSITASSITTSSATHNGEQRTMSPKKILARLKMLLSK